MIARTGGNCTARRRTTPGDSMRPFELTGVEQKIRDVRERNLRRCAESNPRRDTPLRQ